LIRKLPSGGSPDERLLVLSLFSVYIACSFFDNRVPSFSASFIISFTLSARKRDTYAEIEYEYKRGQALEIFYSPLGLAQWRGPYGPA